MRTATRADHLDSRGAGELALGLIAGQHHLECRAPIGSRFDLRSPGVRARNFPDDDRAEAVGQLDPELRLLRCP